MRTTALALTMIVLAATGCKQGSSANSLRTPDQATTEYKQVLAQTCGPKHLDTMAPVDLNTQAKLWYSKLDVPARIQYDKAVTYACSANATQPDCYNQGIMVGAVQDGSLHKFVDQVCAPAGQ